MHIKNRVLRTSSTSPATAAVAVAVAVAAFLFLLGFLTLALNFGLAVLTTAIPPGIT